MKIALIGATGLVGENMLKVLSEKGIPFNDLFLVASDHSVGKRLPYAGQWLDIHSMAEALEYRPDVALMSVGASISKTHAPRFTARGTVVIDNSSAWRMEPDVPLVVPQINAHEIHADTLLIANPNCSTIQMVMALAPLHKVYGLKRLVVSTYQSVTGTGSEAVYQLLCEEHGETNLSVYPHPIHRNLFPHGGDFLPDGYTTEEQKLVDETRKILSAPLLQVTATVVRVPVVGGHSEAINIEFEKDFEIDDVRELLSSVNGVKVMDSPKDNLYPTPAFAEGKNEVFVGRIRRDFSQPHSLNLWVVADNLRKGAATNAVEIMLLPQIWNRFSH